MYEIRILDGAIRDLKRLDKFTGRRIVKRINWLAENFDDVQQTQLTHNLSGLYKLRVGNYRVFYQPLENESVLVIHQIGHRRNIYK